MWDIFVRHLAQLPVTLLIAWGNTVACERSNMYMGKILKNNNRNTDPRRVTGKVY